jgi:superfamily II DNA or RNA helicase
MNLQLMNPDEGYRNEYLWLPKSKIHNIEVVRRSLTFPLEDKGIVLSGLGETKHHYLVPREYIMYEEWSSLDFPIHDWTFDGFPHITVRCSATPRDVVQREAHQALLERGNGVLSLACGKGKTVVSIMAWCDLHVPALVVVHTEDLLKQWKERILEFTSLTEEDIGIYRGKETSWEKPICIAMLKTLAIRNAAFELPEGFTEHFGVVIYDEVHNIGAPFFHECATVGRGQRWGLSATPDRADGLEALYKYHLGDVIYENLEQDIIPMTYFLRLPTEVPSDVIPTLRDRSGEINLAKLQTWMAEDPERNAAIADVINQLVKEGRKILALSNRVYQVDKMVEMFGEDVASKIHGNVGKARDGALTARDLVFASTKLAKEGLDRKDLDTALLLLPVTREGMFRQILGRIQRQAEGKREPIFIIFEDKKIRASVAMCRKLRRHLTSFGYPYETQDL